MSATATSLIPRHIKVFKPKLSINLPRDPEGFPAATYATRTWSCTRTSVVPSLSLAFEMRAFSLFSSGVDCGHVLLGVMPSAL